MFYFALCLWHVILVQQAFCWLQCSVNCFMAWRELNIWWAILMQASILWLSMVTGRLNWWPMWRPMSLCYAFIFFLPSTCVLSSVLFSSGSFSIHCGCLTFSFFSQTSVNLKRCIKGKIKFYISSTSFLLLNSSPLLLISNPLLLIPSSFLSVPCSII